MLKILTLQLLQLLLQLVLQVITGATINVGSSNAVALTIKDVPAGAPIGVGNAAAVASGRFI